MTSSIVISGISDIGKPAQSAAAEFTHLAFETRETLGKKGTRNMDRLTALAISGMADLMPGLGVDRTTPHDEIGIVLGSAQGSMDSIVRFTYETLAHDRPDFVNPALFPNTVMNCAAGQAAIWYRLCGLNTTISCQEMSFLSAIEYSCLQLSRGAARTLVTGSVEELTEVNEAGHRVVARNRNLPVRFSEYSMFVALETEQEAQAKGRAVVAEVGSVVTGFNGASATAGPLVGLIGHALEKAGVAATQIARAVISGTWPEQRAAELEAVRRVLGGSADPLITFDAYGNAGSAQNALQLAQLLAEIGPGQTGLVIAQERAGNMGAMVVRKGRMQ